MFEDPQDLELASSRSQKRNRFERSKGPALRRNLNDAAKPHPQKVG
jgi:hypothetical protein